MPISPQAVHAGILQRLRHECACNVLPFSRPSIEESHLESYRTVKCVTFEIGMQALSTC